MNNTVKLVLSVTSFIICMAIGFLGTEVVRETISKKQSSPAVAMGGAPSQVNQQSQYSASATSASKPTAQKSVAQAASELIRNSTESVPAETPSEEVSVEEEQNQVVEQAPAKEPEPEPVLNMVDPITKNELQDVLMSKSTSSAIQHNFKGRVLPGCKYVFNGLDPQESSPESYNEIINRLNMEAWARVEVTSVSYDKENKLRSATIQVYYE